MQLRFQGTSKEVNAAIDYFKESTQRGYDIFNISKDYPNREDSIVIRRYVELVKKDNIEKGEVTHVQVDIKLNDIKGDYEIKR